MASRPRLSARLLTLRPSATALVAQRANELRAQGVEVFSFAVGESDFDAPRYIVEAAQRALAEGATRYTGVRGLPALREAICADSAARRGVTHRPSEVVVSVGAKHSLFNLCFALLSPGDEAIVPTPCWVSYPEQCMLAGAEVVLVETSAKDGFKLTPDRLRAAVTSRTRALFLCTPSNPTGAAYRADELRALAEVFREGDYWIVVDEIYATLVYGGFEQCSLLAVANDLRERVILVDGVSKRFAMTGFRIGWLLGPEAVAEACETVQSQTTTSATTVAQHAALAALAGPSEPSEHMRRAFERRRNLVLEELSAIPGISWVTPVGAFYVFIDVHKHLGSEWFGVPVENDVDLAGLLLEQASCALVPGSAFYAPGYLRLSYATSEAQLREGLGRIRRLFSAHT